MALAVKKDCLSATWLRTNFGCDLKSRIALADCQVEECQRRCSVLVIASREWSGGRGPGGKL